MQRQEKLPVRETRGQPVRRVHREGRLANPRHPVDRVDPDHPAGGVRPSQPPQQLRQLSLTAGEAADITRQRPGRCRRGRPGRHASPGRQDLVRRGPPAGRRDEQHLYRPGQAQRAGQQQRGVLPGGAVYPPLQVTDRPRGQPSRLCQLLLRQPGLAPQLPQQPGEIQRWLLRHRPIAPPPSPARCPPQGRPRHLSPASKPTKQTGTCHDPRPPTPATATQGRQPGSTPRRGWPVLRHRRHRR